MGREKEDRQTSGKIEKGREARKKRERPGEGDRGGK